MLRYVLLLTSVLVFVSISWAQTDENLYDLIQEIFNSDNEDLASTPISQCNNVEGKVKGCHECYSCEDFRIATFTKKRKVEKVRLKEASCDRSTELCCVAQTDLLLRSGDKCGICNPEGKPRRRRPSLRTLLPGEYPWIAWVYKKSNLELLCPATFINDNYKLFITLASCVQKHSANTLAITFDKREKTQLEVKQILVHKDFDKGRHHNNLALISAKSLEDAPEWAAPACLPTARAEHATPCVTHTHQEKTVNTVIPLRSVCGNDSLNESLTCAVSAPGDLTPQKGAGLYCLEQHVTSPAIVVHGLAISTADDVTDFVDIYQRMRWINSYLNL